MSVVKASSCVHCGVLALATLAGCGAQPATEEATPNEIVFTGVVDADLATIDREIAGGPFAADWDSLAGNGVADWYRDAKLGIFIHWGVYAVPAFGHEWYPRRMYLNELDRRRNVNFFEHHRKTWGPQKTFGYKDFIPMFKAESYDPEAWAALFEEAGARYVVPVEGHLSEERNKQMGPEDIRFTSRGDALYATALGLAEQEWTIESLRAGSEHLEERTVSRVRLLGHDGDLEWLQRSDALAIRRPRPSAAKHAYMFEVTLE